MSEWSGDYDDVIQALGPVTTEHRDKTLPMPDLTGVFPREHLKFIATFGQSVYQRGRFQLCSPLKYKAFTDHVFKGDAQISLQHLYTIGISASGDMLLWEPQRRYLIVDQWYHRVSEFPATQPPDDRNQTADIATAIFSFAREPEFFDVNGDPLFERCLARYGPLKPGQIYAPRLNPAFGGSVTLEQIYVVDALAAMAINMQMAPFNLVDFSQWDNPRVIRQLGAGGR